MKAVGCQSNGMSKQRDVKRNSCRSTWMLKQMRLVVQKPCFHIFNFRFWRDVSHQSFVFTSSTVSFWGTSPSTDLFSHLQPSVFGGCLAPTFVFTSSTFSFWGTPKFLFHIFNLQLLKDVSHQSFVFTSSTRKFREKSSTKASLSHLQLSGLVVLLRLATHSLQTLL